MDNTIERFLFLGIGGPGFWDKAAVEEIETGIGRYGKRKEAGPSQEMWEFCLIQNCVLASWCQDSFTIP